MELILLPMFCGTVYKVCRLSCQDLLLVPLLGYCQAELICHSLAVFSLPWSLLSSVDALFRSSSAGVMSWGLGSVGLFSSSSKCSFHLLLCSFSPSSCFPVRQCIYFCQLWCFVLLSYWPLHTLFLLCCLCSSSAWLDLCIFILSLHYFLECVVCDPFFGGIFSLQVFHGGVWWRSPLYPPINFPLLSVH